MKVEEVPQDLKYFEGTVVRDADYAVDAEGNYQMVVSDGWAPKNEALEVTLADIDEQCQEILQRVKAGESSLLEYYAAKNLMDGWTWNCCLTIQASQNVLSASISSLAILRNWMKRLWRLMPTCFVSR